MKALGYSWDRIWTKFEQMKTDKALEWLKNNPVRYNRVFVTDTRLDLTRTVVVHGVSIETISKENNKVTMFPVGTSILYTEEGGITFVKGHWIENLWLDQTFHDQIESARKIILKQIFNNFRRETSDEYFAKKMEHGVWDRYHTTHHCSFTLTLENNRQKLDFDTLTGDFKTHDPK